MKCKGHGVAKIGGFSGFTNTDVKIYYKATIISLV